ncbi:FAD-binding oxidoreductase [Paenimyroides tangerinum]|uniref:FAD-binding oxidoreductase n=1 Tax=Paenimyroides tangerinum TaxID=2488728 RepID=A0A3P3WFH8_9FLAO|nr:PepSY domain-containing protein [Paenimyroides tangerinum]RRJ93178.1 FAD-binding oxidoreductase [Paenimyroides tangerinum]
MTKSVWRFAHLVLAIFSFLFLLIASVTGTILAVDAAYEKTSAPSIENFNQITVAQSITGLRKVFPEILELNIDATNSVIAEGFNDEGEDFKAIVNPVTGEILAQPKPKSEFIEWVTSFHRSLFLHETGRFIVGFVSFLLLLITISGTVLIIKRQLGIRNFFSKVISDFSAQYFHVVAGRLLLIPILIISLTGSYLFMLRFDVISKPELVEISHESNSTEEFSLEDIPVFKETLLSDVTKIEFPFSDDPEEFFRIKLKDKEIQVNQITGEIVSEIIYPKETVFETLSLDLHTGRTNAVWAIILGIASLNILVFIYTGFVITFKRTSVKIKNKFKPTDAEIVILVGSEGGSTTYFANRIHQQFLNSGKKSYFATLNEYQQFPKASELIVLASTYGLGEAPSNAGQFKKLVAKFPQSQNIHFSVLGFGSTKYADFCAFAFEVDTMLTQQNNFNRKLQIHTINKKSVAEFVNWVNAYNEISDIKIENVSAIYQMKLPKLSKFTVLENKKNANDSVFQISLQTKKKFQSGDLLAIYPANDAQERLYSIAKVNGNLQLVVKLHEFGLGSQFLHRLQKNDQLKARIITNEHFHVPTDAKSVIMIGNGTGIAPFLGMINENISHKEMHLFVGFRHRNETVLGYEAFAKSHQEKKQLTDFTFAFSREENPKYVMQIIEEQAQLIADKLAVGAVIMICGSLKMQKDVEVVLDKIVATHNDKSLTFYKEQNQIKTDCY